MLVRTLFALLILISSGTVAQHDNNKTTFDLQSSERQTNNTGGENVIPSGSSMSHNDISEQDDNLTLAEQVEQTEFAFEEKKEVDTGTYERMGSFLTMSDFLNCLNEAGERSSAHKLFECTKMFAIQPKYGRLGNSNQMTGSLN